MTQLGLILADQTQDRVALLGWRDLLLPTLASRRSASLPRHEVDPSEAHALHVGLAIG